MTPMLDARPRKTRQKSVARKAKLVQQFQADLACPDRRGKIFPFFYDANHRHNSAIPFHRRGGSRVVTNAGRDVVDARALARQSRSQGEMNLVSDRAARKTNGARTYGQTMWS
jgi:hypothetical protein